MRTGAGSWPSQSHSPGEFAELLSQAATATSHHTPMVQRLWTVSPLLSPAWPPAPKSFAQHLPAGPGPPVLLLTPPAPLALWLPPLGALLRGVRPCWVPALPGLSSLGTRGPASLGGPEQVWASGSAWGSVDTRGCSGPSSRDTGLSWAPGFELSTEALS